MTENITRQSVLFSDLLNKPLHAAFDQPDSSSDGGAILLKACDRRLGLIDAISACLRDDRQQNKIHHSAGELIRQRIFGIACGYEDCNDAARLKQDPVHHQLVDREVADDSTLASQSTLSRFENMPEGRSLLRMGHALADCVVARHKKRLKKGVRRITIDMDPTDDPTYGSQQLTLFNSHYDNWCYLPLACFLTFDNEPENYLFAYVLRPGDATAHYGAISILRRIIGKLRESFSAVALRVRLDGGFASPEVLEFLDDQGVEYVVAMAGNAVLKAEAEPLMKKSRQMQAKSNETEHLFGECLYQAGSWDTERRVIIKAEVVCHPGREPKDNARFVITNIKRSPTFVYCDIYCQRAPIENRIKELLYGLNIDRTSCTQFLANQFRVLLTASAYVLFQELRLKAKYTSFAKAQVNTLRERLIKLAVWIQSSTRRVVYHLPNSAPWSSEWCQIARAVGASDP